MSDNDPSQPHHSIAHNAKYGMILFLIYLALYGGFVGITAFSFKTMGIEVFAGISLAVWYGLGLIAAALVLAGVYMFIARSEGSK